MAINRGRERPLHAEGKQMLARLLSRCGFLVLFEQSFADVVAFQPGEGGIVIVCGEHELTKRNVRRNVQRNFANGCHAMVILVPDEASRAGVRRLLQRAFPRPIWTRIGILTHETCRRQLRNLFIER